MTSRLFRTATAAAVAVLLLASLLVGGYDISLPKLFTDPAAQEMFWLSRVPRTLALVFAAAAMSISGVIMQMVTQNKFVEPSTAGTSQWAGLGMLVVLLIAPEATPVVKMLVATGFAFLGTWLFLAILDRIRLRSSVVVPLVGIMLGAVVGAATTYLAGTFNLMQALTAWRSGGFSGIVQGFYEPLWIVAGIAVAAFLVADRFTVAGLGQDMATGLGLNYRRVVFLGVIMVALATGVTSVVVGFIPFLGLIVPNMVSMILGDDLRRNLPWVVAAGVALLLACDLIGRVLVAPMEIPASVVLGALGAIVFIILLLRAQRTAAAPALERERA
ncbi:MULTISPECIES: iron chelate uptake ABC transporter family permease subunit [Arthrobacter]|uniref:Iron chelate uptake ABC transporter family permease subunit n=2 Tax=Arthrobacter TaxID=1663 RepID=A0ABU9KKQ9_9MICC|nr:iron chelate uptake ABC transporter family permease subunit [Arthrobacter sp. YJM1]MDP5226299.1 iron chelate uptake ABC transporter family permease subunit [Arthrobacter sp. YJM1]